MPSIWTYAVGAVLIAVYYRIGPVAADIIRDRPLLRRLSYCWIVRPAGETAARRIGRIPKDAR